jgi:ABC-type polysaccharide/polyol phosphate export permease
MARSAATMTIRRYGDTQLRTAAAVNDLVHGARDWTLWSSLGWLDVKQRYRRAALGPFWITISTGVMVLALGILYAGIFRQGIRDFLPYLATGFIVWGFISATITEGTAVFVQAEGLIKQGGIPLSLHVFRTVYRNLIVNAHNLTVVAVLYIWEPSLLSWNLLLFVPGLLLVVANLTWISMLVGLLCTRFRDLPPIVGNVLQVFFFMSPIMYKPSSLPPQLTVIVKINPLFYFIDALRAPLLGGRSSVMTYGVLALIAIVGWAVTFRLFRFARTRIPYWV